MAVVEHTQDLAHSPAAHSPELPNLVSLLAERFPDSHFGHFLHQWESVIFSLVIVLLLSLAAYLVSRRLELVPGRSQGALELLVGGFDSFICGIMGSKGRKYTPFIGTLFIYILLMNLFGLLPLMKSSTSSLSVTLGLALCVFIYVQYTGFKELGFVGYIDHMMGNPRGFLAFSVVIPLIMFFLHIVGELVKPLSLALRLRSNIWGEDMLLGVLSGFGLVGVPLFIFSALLVIVGSLVQAVVFALLTTIYFSLMLKHDEHETELSAKN